MCPTSQGRIIRECITTEGLHSLADAKRVSGPSGPTKYFLFLFYFKCPDVGMECEVWLEKSFYEIIKVERWSRGHLKPNYGYLESSLDISAFHYLVQTGFSRQNKWRLNGDLSLPSHSCLSSGVTGGLYSKHNGSDLFTQLKSHQQIIFLHLSLDSQLCSDLSSN